MRRTALLLLLIPGACVQSPSDPGSSPSTRPGGSPDPARPRVLVLNTLSETLSSLDPETGRMTVQAGLAGTWANRITSPPRSGKILVTASGANEVQILDAGDLGIRATIDVGTGSNPWVAFPLSPHRAIVTDWLSGDVRMLDLAAGTAGPPLRTTPGPEGVAVVGSRAFVAGTNYRGGEGGFAPGRLDVVDLERWEIVASIAVGRNPQDVAVGPGGRVHVVCTGTYGEGPVPEAGSVHVVDPGTLGVVGVVDLGGSPGRLAPDDRGVVWVAGFSGGLRRYDAASLEILPDPPDPALLAPGLSAVAWDARTGVAYVAVFDQDLLVAVDGRTVEVVGAWLVGDGPVDVLVFRPEADGGRSDPPGSESWPHRLPAAEPGEGRPSARASAPETPWSVRAPRSDGG